MGQLADVPLQRYGAHDGSPGDPAGEVMQVPALPVWLQLSQDAAHAELQQTPSAQKPLVHSAALLQELPFAFFGTHDPLALQ